MARTCKFYKIKQLVSYDCGESWEATGRYDKGALYEANSRDCGFMLIYRWALSAGDYDCDGVRKYNMEVLQFTTEQGGEYQNVSPEYKRRTGSVVDWLSTDCGYVESTGGFKFSGTSVVNCGTKPSGSAYTESTLYRQEVSAITAPHSVVGDCTEVIGASAFSDSVLETIDISSYTKEIQSYAFADCSGITSMVIPDTVEKIGTNLFAGCPNITGATLPSGIDYIPNSLFLNCDSVSAYTIPSGVTSVGSSAFGNSGFWGDTASTRHNLEIVFNEDVTYLSSHALVGNDFNGTLSLPSSLKYIGNECFRGCIFDDELVIPDGVEHIDYYFITQDYVTETGLGHNLSIPGSMKLAQLPYMGNYWYSDIEDNTGITGITFHEGTEAFYHYGYGYNIPDFNIPNSTLFLLEDDGGYVPYATGEYEGDGHIGEIRIPSNVKVINSSYVCGLNVGGRRRGITIFESLIPPVVIGDISCSIYQNQDILVPDESVDLYRTMWSEVADRIKPASGLMYEWRRVSLSTYYICVGVDKHYADDLWVSTDSGNTWHWGGAYRAGELYEANSSDCGYRTRVISGSPYCVGYDKYVSTSSQTSSDYGETWNTTSTAETLVEHNSVDCGYIPSGVTSVVTYNNGRDASITDCSTSTVPTYSGKTIVDTIVIGNCARTIPTKAFYECTSARSLTMVDGVTSIGVNAFYGCEGLTGSVTIPDSVTNLGDYSFRKCSGITSFSISSGITSIGKTVFSECGSMTGITIPSSITSIGDTAFWLCVGIVDINLPDSVASIGQSCFASCTSLSSVTIGTGITSIGESAFENCSGLTSVTIAATSVPTLGEYAFDNTNNCPIYVPAGSVNIYKATSGWSDYASRIQAIP